MMPQLQFCDVTFKYPTDDYIILKNISFEVEKGDFVSIIGASGCGKSTVFRLINGLETDYTGSILINGVKAEKNKSYAAFMPQRDLLLPWRDILNNVALPLEGKVPKAERLQKAKATLEKVGLCGYENKYPSELSGGMRQRASFARTLLVGGEMMLLDEPFSALDNLTRIAMQDWLLSMTDKLQKTVLMITHDIDEAMLLGRKLLVMIGKPVTELKIFDVSGIACREDLYGEYAAKLKKELTSYFTVNLLEGRT